MKIWQDNLKDFLVMMWTSPNEICYYVGEVILVSTKTACDNKGKNIIQVLSYDSGMIDGRSKTLGGQVLVP